MKQHTLEGLTFFGVLDHAEAEKHPSPGADACRLVAVAPLVLL